MLKKESYSENNYSIQKMRGESPLVMMEIIETHLFEEIEVHVDEEINIFHAYSNNMLLYMFLQFIMEEVCIKIVGTGLVPWL